MTRSDDQQNVLVCRAIWIVKFSSLSPKVLLGAAAWKTDVEVEITIVKRAARDQAMNKMLPIMDPEIYSGRCSTRFLSLSSTDLAEVARFVLPRPRANILPVRPSHSVNNMYILYW